SESLLEKSPSMERISEIEEKGTALRQLPPRQVKHLLLIHYQNQHLGSALQLYVRLGRNNGRTRLHAGSRSPQLQIFQAIHAVHPYTAADCGVFVPSCSNPAHGIAGIAARVALHSGH